jgi:molecular chaperone GrpE
LGKKGAERQAEPAGDEVAPELAALEAEDAARAAAEQAAGAALAEPAPEAVARLERELSEWKDRALRATADYDNYRKRAVREREEAYLRGQTGILQQMLDVVDDLARVAHLDPATTGAEAFQEGMIAIERKFLKTLELSGVERIEAAGAPFDPNSHEAVATMPAADESADQTVGAVYQHGYRFKGVLLRPARVVVLQFSPPGDTNAGPAA